MSHVQQQLGNISVRSVNSRFDGRDSDGEQSRDVFSRVSTEAPNPKFSGKQCNGSAGSASVNGQHVVYPLQFMAHKVYPAVLQYQQYQCWSTASPCSTKAS